MSVYNDRKALQTKRLLYSDDFGDYNKWISQIQ